VIVALILWLQVSGGAHGVRDEVRVEEGRVQVHRGTQSCNVSLSDGDRERLAAALREVRPQSWKDKYLDDCRDCSSYSLQVGDRTIVWNSSAASQVPADARRVASVMLDLMTCQ
jgi:hypothetical protein